MVTTDDNEVCQYGIISVNRLGVEFKGLCCVYHRPNLVRRLRKEDERKGPISFEVGIMLRHIPGRLQ